MSKENDSHDSPQKGKENGAGAAGDRRRDLPDPPDIRRVHRLREQVKVDREAGRISKGVNFGKFDPTTGKRLRDAGFYTLIPMVMVAGPLLGYFIGLFLEKKFGGEPWPVTCGVLIGLVAGFRQVFLMLADKTNPPPRGK